MGFAGDAFRAAIGVLHLAGTNPARLPDWIGVSMDYETSSRSSARRRGPRTWSAASHRTSGTKGLSALPARSGLPKDFIRLCPWEMEYVFAVARRARTGILEIGRLNGGSTFLMACANSEVPIHSIDISPVDDALLQQFFATHGVGGTCDSSSATRPNRVKSWRDRSDLHRRRPRVQGRLRRHRDLVSASRRKRPSAVSRQLSRRPRRAGRRRLISFSSTPSWKS